MSANKEMNIVFVYDRERCLLEEDDPINAVSYFHPSWVSDVHRLTLCGQLMGVAQFLNLNFCEARTIVLQSGKFILTPFGRFVLVVGTDRCITDAALTYRSELLANVVRMYHKGLETVYEQCMANSSNYKTVTDKFYHIFEKYLPHLQHQSSVFNSLPTLKMPPSANCVFVEAIQTLQDCRQLKGVLGGTILYHNKIVATQLPSHVSKLLVLTDPHRIKTTAAQVNVPYHVPVGVQLVTIYMSLRDYQRLRNDSQRAFSLQNGSVQNGGQLPFHIKPKAKAKPKSLMFSNIPEEEAVNGFSETLPNGVSKPKPRPNFLPLHAKNGTTRDSDTGFNSFNLDETDSFPQFIFKTTVSSTPLMENKILPGSLLPICANPVILEEVPPIEEQNNNTSEVELPKNDISERTFENFRGNSLKTALIRSTSVRAIQNIFTTKNEVGRMNGGGKPKYQTITDPSYPVFNDDGLPISKYMFDQCGIEMGVDIAQDVESLKIEGFPTESEIREDPEDKCNGQAANASNSLANGDHPVDADPINEIVFRNKPKDPASEDKRKSLSLPIKAINLDTLPKTSDLSNTGSAEEDSLSDLKPVKWKRADFAETPIRSKIIAQLPFGASWSSAMTPVMTPIDCNKALVRRRSSITKVEEEREEDGAEESEANELQKVELFVCGQQNMAMLVAMEDNSGQREDLVKSLWETSISRLPKIESNLQQTLNVNVDGVVDKNDMNYSFMCFDPNWDVTHQGGHWSTLEMQAVEDIHADFKENGSFTETLVRCNDSVIYGYRCGDSEVYYKQPTSQLRGIAQPGDGMGNAPLNAKRRLERDHSIILL